MSRFNPRHGIGTLVVHTAEDDHPYHANVAPIYQSSIFRMPDVETGAKIFTKEVPGYVYSRLSNPNLDQVAEKLAVLEGLDLLRAQPERPAGDLVGARIFSSGMAAVTSAILARMRAGQTIIAQEALYSGTYQFLTSEAARLGIHVVFLNDPDPHRWEEAFAAHPDAPLAYAESPVNPSMQLVDLQAVARIAHAHGAWLMVDNTFATPYCQRPLTLGADVIVHSTTKYLNGHGLIIGGALVTTRLDWLKTELNDVHKIYGGTASPFDSWLLNNGLKTFELRMQRQCENALKVAQFLEGHPAVREVFYPGLESSPYHELALRQMMHFGGMVSFELKGGVKAGVSMMNGMRVCRLAVSLGHLDSLIEHPASMTHFQVDAETRRKTGISDGLVRFSVGIENIEDILEDLDQAMQ
jgi:methionine-gamma-lyase